MLFTEQKPVLFIHEYLNKIDTSSHFLLGLINDILDLSKIENGEMTLHESPFTKEEFKDSIEKILESGMNCHMAKPIDPPVLYRTILKYLENK